MIRAEHLLHGIPDLEERAIGLGGVDDRRKHVLGCRGRRGEASERLFRPRGIAIRAQRGEPGVPKVLSVPFEGGSYDLDLGYLNYLDQ